MTDFDSTNSGVVFQPHENQKLSAQGKLNLAGTEHRVVLVREPVKRDGEPQLVVYVKAGVLFPQDRSDNEKAPNFSGPLYDDLRIAAWSKEKDGRKFLSLKVSEKRSAGDMPEAYAGSREPSYGGYPDDSIPF